MFIKGKGFYLALPLLVVVLAKMLHPILYVFLIFYFIFKIKTVRSDRLYNIHLLIIVKTGFIRKFMTIAPVIYIIYTDSLYMFYIIHKNLYLR